MTSEKVIKIIKSHIGYCKEGANPMYALGYETCANNIMREINHTVQRELDGEMTELGQRNYELIVEAVKTTGDFDPKEIFFMFEERLYMHEADTIEAFLQWIVDGGVELKHGFIKHYHRSFGRDNYEEKFQEFLNQR